MLKKFITTSEAIKSLMNGMSVKADLTDGLLTIKRKKNNTFSAVIFSVDASSRNEIFSGNFSSLMKTMHKLNHEWYIEQLEA